MKSIVVPVNFSASAANAARYAADMALAVGADVHLFHALHVPVRTSQVPLPDAAFEMLQENGKFLLDQLADELGKRTYSKTRITTNMEIGDMEYRLEKFCQEKKPFVVVMGTSGDFLQRIMVGDHTSKAIRHLSSPVLVVPDGAVFAGVKKIALACDLEDIVSGISNGRPFLQELGNIFGADFDVLNIMSGFEKNEVQVAFEFDSWKTQLRGIHPELHFVRADRLTDGIQRYLAHHAVDWLIVFPKKHHLLELHRSRAKKIVLDCPIPVMSVHE
jgi:nucleotide-binding universal stress UspA family protein